MRARFGEGLAVNRQAPDSKVICDDSIAAPFPVEPKPCIYLHARPRLIKSQLNSSRECTRSCSDGQQEIRCAACGLYNPLGS